MNCAGCGINIGEIYRLHHLEDEFCSSCNARYYAWEAKESAILAAQRKRRWEEMVAMYGEDNAAEIWADMMSDSMG